MTDLDFAIMDGLRELCTDWGDEDGLRDPWAKFIKVAVEHEKNVIRAGFSYIWPLSDERAERRDREVKEAKAARLQAVLASWRENFPTLPDGKEPPDFVVKLLEEERREAFRARCAADPLVSLFFHESECDETAVVVDDSGREWQVIRMVDEGKR
jgi:hypothetical protein